MNLQNYIIVSCLRFLEWFSDSQVELSAQAAEISMPHHHWLSHHHLMYKYDQVVEKLALILSSLKYDMTLWNMTNMTCQNLKTPLWRCKNKPSIHPSIQPLAFSSPLPQYILPSLHANINPLTARVFLLASELKHPWAFHQHPKTVNDEYKVHLA